MLQHQAAASLFSCGYCASHTAIGMASGSWSPSWPCVFSLFGRCKVQSHMAVSALCWGRGSNPLALILPVQGACHPFFLQLSVQAAWFPLGAAALVQGSEPCAWDVFWLTLSIHVLFAASPSVSATSLPLLGLMFLQVNSQPMCIFYMIYTLLLRVLPDFFFFIAKGRYEQCKPLGIRLRALNVVFHKLLSHFDVWWLFLLLFPSLQVWKAKERKRERSPFPLLARMLFSHSTCCQIANIWVEGSAKVLRGSALGSSFHTFLSLHSGNEVRVLI